MSISSASDVPVMVAAAAAAVDGAAVVLASFLPGFQGRHERFRMKIRAVVSKCIATAAKDSR